MRKYFRFHNNVDQGWLIYPMWLNDVKIFCCQTCLQKAKEYEAYAQYLYSQWPCSIVELKITHLFINLLLLLHLLLLMKVLYIIYINKINICNQCTFIPANLIHQEVHHLVWTKRHSNQNIVNEKKNSSYHALTVPERNLNYYSILLLDDE